MALAIFAAADRSAQAIGPRAPAVGAATADAAHPEVGLIGNQDSNPGNNQTYFGTGTKVATAEPLLTNNFVVTAAHVLDSDFLINNQLQYSSQTNEFKLDGQPAVRGLGIPHPNYNPLNGNMGANDVGLILTAAPLAGASAQLVGAGPGDVAVGDVITLVGYGGGGNGGNPPGGPFGTRLTGTANVAAGLTASNIPFSVPVPSPAPPATNTNWTEGGDSGSPYFKTFAAPVGTRIVGIHNRGSSAAIPPNPVTFAGQRVTDPAVFSFLQGNGIGDAANTGLILSWNANANGNFNSVVRWNSGVGGVNTPGLRHIAYINTAGATPVISVTADTPELLGLLNDDQLDVTAGTLRVTGSATAPGLFNGANGIINVGTNRAIQTSAFDNTGTINVAPLGQILASQASYNQAMLNVNGDVIGGGTIRRGIVAFNGGGRNLAAGKIVIDVGALEARGFDNRGMITLTGGGMAIQNNTNLTNSGMITANQRLIAGGIVLSQIDVTGNLNNSGMFMLDRGSKATIAGTTTNSGSISAANRATDVAQTPSTLALNGNTTNAAGGTIAASLGGMVISPKTVTVTNDGTLSGSTAGSDLRLGTVLNRASIDISASARYIGDTLTTSGNVDVRSAVMYLDTNLTNTGTISVTGPLASKGILAARTLNNMGTFKEGPEATIGYVNRPNRGTWTKDPSMSVGVNTLVAPTGIFNGAGFELVGGNFENFSQENVLFDMTATEMRFIDRETLAPLQEDIDSEDDLFNPSPSFVARNVSRMVWPSTDQTPGDPATPGGATLYVRSLSLTAGPEDDPTMFDTIQLFGEPPMLVPRVTTLDMRGSVMYLADPLSMTPNTRIYDSLNPLRPLSDMIRPLSLGLFPTNNFAIDRFVLDGADYVVLAPVPEPMTAVLLALGGVMAAWRRRARRNG